MTPIILRLIHRKVTTLFIYERRFAKQRTQGEDISYINAHGTGTKTMTKRKSRHAAVFEKVPPFSSTKSYTGHTLGAAGAVEAVYSILNLVHQEIYPSLFLEIRLSKRDSYPFGVCKTRIRNVMSNSFGFGGNCSTLIFSKT